MEKVQSNSDFYHYMVYHHTDIVISAVHNDFYVKLVLYSAETESATYLGLNWSYCLARRWTTVCFLTKRRVEPQTEGVPQLHTGGKTNQL